MYVYARVSLVLYHYYSITDAAQRKHFLRAEHLIFIYYSSVLNIPFKKKPEKKILLMYL